MKRIFRRSAERDWDDWSASPEEVRQRSPAMTHIMESAPSKSLVIHTPIISDWVVDE
ncbi:hypothetical protein H6F97_04530 [Microcoleus sp. FACHB-1]|nr:hypothetical protein [Microcoleus sp. FACHB-1]